MLIDNSKSKAQRIFDFLHSHIIIIIVAVVVLAGAISTFSIINDSDDESKPDEGKQTNVTYEDMKTVYLAIDNVKSLNPLSSRDEDTYYISQIVYNGLFKLNKNLNITRDLVSKYTTDADEGTVNITLKGNARYSDGSYLNASDVAFTVGRIKAIGSKGMYYNYAKKISSVTITGPKSLIIRFKSPKDAALDNLVFPIVSSRGYSSDNNQIPGTGPYKLGKKEDGKKLKLSKNKYYFDGKAANNIEFKIVNKKKSTPGFITADLVTAYVSRAQDSDVEAEDKNLKYTPIVSSEMDFLGFNCKKGIFRKASARKAVALAINAKNIIEENYGGNAVLSDSVYYPGFVGSGKAKNVYDEDQRAAAELLEKSGCVDVTGNGYLDDEKGNEITLSLVVDKSNESRLDTAYSVESYLEKVGLKVKVQALDRKAYKKAVRNKKFDIYIGGYKFDKQYNLTELFDKKNPIGYNNKDVLKYVKKLETTLTTKEQTATYKQLSKLLLDEVPYYCICYKTYGFMTTQHFESNGQIPTFFDVFRGCTDWKWQKTVAVDDEKSESDDEDSKDS